MLKVKSFKISDSEGINELLSNNQMAEGGILVSNGEVCIPYEDGQEPTNAQKIVVIKKELNTEKKKFFVIRHNQTVLRKQMDAVKEQLETLEKDDIMPNSKEKYDNNKEIKEKKKHLENVMAQFEMSYIKNQAEIDRFEVEFEVYEERIKDLSK